MKINSPSDLPALEYLSKLFIADFCTGTLIWKKRPAEWFKDNMHAKTWNKRFAGKIAGTEYTNKYGYTRRGVRIDGKRYTEHHILWYMFYKEPIDKSIFHIDHIDGDATNNSILNLRKATRIQNAANRDVKGYYWDERKCRWLVSFETGGETLLRVEVVCENLAKDLYAYMCCTYHREYTRFYPFEPINNVSSYKGVTEAVLNSLQKTLTLTEYPEFVRKLVEDTQQNALSKKKEKE